MRLLAGLATPLTGELTLAGNPVRTKRDRRHMCRYVGYAAQRCEQQLFCDTVEEDVAYGPANQGYRGAELTARVQATLELLDIAPLAQADPFALSGGQQRLVALAGVLAMRPQLLLLDEPLAGLDAWHRTHVKTLLKRLQSQGMGIIIVTHEMEDAAQLANRIQVLSHGQTVLEGTPYQVFSQQTELRRLGLGVPPTLQFARDLAAAGGPLLETPQNPCLTQEDLLATLLATYAPGAAAPLAEKRREVAVPAASAVPTGTVDATTPAGNPATSGTVEVNA
jgi:energy-coupling factor transport system ATP-binding protein